MMTRVWIPVGLTIPTLILPGCAIGGRWIDPMADYRPDRERVAFTPGWRSDRKGAECKVGTSSDMKSVGTVGRGPEQLMDLNYGAYGPARHTN
jgi:hypothetical protein